MNVIENHYCVEELYMEYGREGCLEKDAMRCNRCEKAEWVEPKFSRIPAPYPDPDNAGHVPSSFQETKNDQWEG